jgi:hypothetical protein
MTSYDCITGWLQAPKASQSEYTSFIHLLKSDVFCRVEVLYPAASQAYGAAALHKHCCRPPLIMNKTFSDKAKSLNLSKIWFFIVLFVLIGYFGLSTDYLNSLNVESSTALFNSTLSITVLPLRTPSTKFSPATATATLSMYLYSVL